MTIEITLELLLIYYNILMVIIENDWKKYEAIEIVERTKEDIEQEIQDRQWFIDKIKITDISKVKPLIDNWVIEQDVLDLIIENNKKKELEILDLELLH